MPIQNPSDTDRTEDISSVTIRTPDGRVVSRWSCATVRARGGLVPRAVRVAVAHAAASPRVTIAAAVTPIAAAIAAVAAVAAAGAVTWTAITSAVAAVAAAVTIAVAPRRAGVAAADGRQLLDGLAHDLGVIGQSQADSATLAVDLDDADVDLVALVELLLDRRDPAARGDVRDVQQAVRALRRARRTRRTWSS